MATQKGSLFLLKVGDGGGPETFTTVAGMQATNFKLNTGTVDRYKEVRNCPNCPVDRA